MNLIPQRIAYWMDYYRCRPPEFTTWDIDSFISFMQVYVDDQGRRVGDRPVPLGWSYKEPIYYDMARFGFPAGTTVEKQVVCRARGQIFVDEDVDVNNVVRLLTSYRMSIAPRPLDGFDVDCASSWYSAASSSMTPAESSAAYSSAFSAVSSMFMSSSSGLFSSSSTQRSSAQQSSVPASSVPESSVPESSVPASSVPESSYSSSSVDLCQAIGCPGGFYHELTVVGGPTSSAALLAFSSSAEDICLSEVAAGCAVDAVSVVLLFPGFWKVEGHVCCVPMPLTDINFDFQIAATPVPITYPDLVPENQAAIGALNTLTGIHFQSSSSSLGFPQPNTPMVVVFNSVYPKRCCLTDGVSIVEIIGVFSNPLTSSASLVYNSGLADLFGGGRAYFVNNDPGLPDIMRLDAIRLVITDCSCSSSGGSS